MKRLSALILALLMCASICGCASVPQENKSGKIEGFLNLDNEVTGNDESIAQTTDANPSTAELGDEIIQESDYDKFFTSFDVEIAKSDNYILYTNKFGKGKRFEIYNSYGELLDYGFCDQRCDLSVKQEGNFLTVKHFVGGPVTYYKYFDVTGSGRVSGWIQNPVDVYETCVACYNYTDIDNYFLTVRDLFDPSKKYIEIRRDFSNAVIRSSPEGEFLDNGTKLKLKYWAKPDDREVEEVFDLTSIKININSK